MEKMKEGRSGCSLMLLCKGKLTELKHVMRRRSHDADTELLLTLVAAADTRTEPLSSRLTVG